MTAHRVLGLVSSLALLLLSTASFAQTPDAPPSAATVAGWAREFLASATSIEADFQQDAWVRAYQRSQTSRGRLVVSRPGRIRLDYTTPAPNVVVSDGERAVYYEAFEEGGGGLYDEAPATQVTSAFALLSGELDVERDFTVTLHPTTSAPAGTVCIELAPRVATPQYTRLRLYVSTAPETRGRIDRLSFESAAGDWNTFTFRGLRIGAEIETSRFHFTPPAGARRRVVPR